MELEKKKEVRLCHECEKRPIFEGVGIYCRWCLDEMIRGVFDKSRGLPSFLQERKPLLSLPE